MAIVLGSGLGVLEERMEIERSASFGALGLPESTVQGHAGRMVVGYLGRTRIVAVSGRVHLYEGHTPARVVRYVRALHGWGVRRLILTCSAGGVSEGMEPGALVLIRDHLNLMGASPLVGPMFGAVRFPDMTTPYDPQLSARIVRAASEVEVPLQEGIYAAMMGPAYETPAEVRMVRSLGADLVGMSTVPEVLAAAELGLPTAALAVVSNKASGLSAQPLSHDEVTEAARQVAESFCRVLERACETNQKSLYARIGGALSLGLKRRARECGRGS